jgi:hypothetical protein
VEGICLSAVAKKIIFELLVFGVGKKELAASNLGCSASKASEFNMMV